MSDSDPPLLKELGESLKEPLNFIMKLTKLGVFAQNKSLPKSYKHSLPKIIVLDEASEGNRVMKGLVGLDLPTGFFFPIVVKFETDSTATCRKILFEYRCKDIHTEKKELVNGPNLGTVIFDKMKAVTDEKISDAEAIVTVVEPADVCSFMMIYLPRIHKQYDRVEDERQVQRFEDYVHRYTGDGRCLFLNVLSTSTSIDYTLSRQVLSRLDAQDILAAHVKLEDCVILHVISATTADIRTSESNKIIKKFDEYGDRTLHVFTKADKGSEDMVAIVTTNYMGPDYVCVRNRLGDETHEEARAKEVSLFKTPHHLLSKIDKSMVGVPVVAQKLFKLQLEGIIKCLCGLVWFINKDLNTCVVQHNRLLQQHNFTTISEAMPAFLQIISESQKSLRKLVLCNESDEFPDETQMECRTKLREMTSELSQQLAKHDEQVPALEAKKWSLEQAFQFLFERKIADMSKITSLFVSRVWDYIGFVIIKVLELHAQKSYPQLFLALKKAATKVIATQKESFKSRLLELLDMKKMRVYTHDVGDIYTWNDMKKKMVDCTELVRKNFFHSTDLDLPNMVITTVAPELEPKMMNELKNDGETRYKPMLKESSSMTTRKGKLKSRIELLQELKKVVEKAMDEISLL